MAKFSRMISQVERDKITGKVETPMQELILIVDSRP